jgi:acyl dehydratase
MRTFHGIDEIVAAVGETVGPSEWLTVEQKRIDTFADATDDHQWIHVNPEKAATGPFGTTIAHGYLTLSLLPALAATIWKFEGVRMLVNAGLDRVRFLAPVPAGGRIRSTITLVSAEPADGGLRLSAEHTVSVEGTEKPACVAVTVTRLYA